MKSRCEATITVAGTTTAQLLLLLLLILSCCLDLSSAQECAADGICDTHERCSVWREQGECYRNAEYMAEHCPAACRNVTTHTVNGCDDIHPRCSVWAQIGECTANPTDMQRYCAKSCKVCGTTTTSTTAASEEREAIEQQEPLCVDKEENCSFWASKGECAANPRYMQTACAKSCGTCDKAQHRQTNGVKMETDALSRKTAAFGETQTVEGNDMEKTIDVVRKSVEYMNGHEALQLPKDLYNNCRNRHALCSFWAAVGECEKNQAYMVTNCAPSCRSCIMLNMEARCPPLKDAKPGLVPGGLNKMFERIVSTAPGNKTTLTDTERQELVANNLTEYTVAVYSRPSTSPSIEVSTVLDQSLPPWVVTFDNFLTDEECDSLIQLGYKNKYERSEDVGAKRFDGTYDGFKSEGRTSENAWCSSRSGCRDESIPQRVHNRIAKVIGIPPENSEDFQILKYEVGQFYNTHHDYIAHQKDRHGGPRILTFFMYLSDVEAGGGTNFPNLDITVMPKKGRALLWPSVYDSDPLSKDGRTTHQALPVEGGTKFAANGWIHQYDYQAAQERGCN